MKRKSSLERLDLLIEAAIKIFMRVDYRRAQIADIAREMGVAPGTIYLYVESKEALFDLALRHAAGDAPPIDTDHLPLPTPSADLIAAWARAKFTRSAFTPIIDMAAVPAPAELRAELNGVITELYTRIHRRHRALRMIEKSALDWPELFDLFYGARRDVLRELTEYLEARIRQRRLRPVPDTGATARLILETISWFAYHRPRDPDSDCIDDETALATVVDALVNAYCVIDER